MVYDVNEGWKLISFGPINLWNFPKQQRDYDDMRKPNIQQDNRARSLKLNPRPRQTNPNSQVVITPALGVGHNLQTEQILRCYAMRNGARC